MKEHQSVCLFGKSYFKHFGQDLHLFIHLLQMQLLTPMIHSFQLNFIDGKLLTAFKVTRVDGGKEPFEIMK